MPGKARGGLAGVESLDGATPRVLAKACAELRVVEQGGDRAGQGLGVIGLNEPGRIALGREYLPRAAHVGGHNRQPRRGGFQQHAAQRLLRAGCASSVNSFNSRCTSSRVPKNHARPASGPVAKAARKRRSYTTASALLEKRSPTMTNPTSA